MNELNILLAGYIFVTRLFGVKAMVFTKEDGILINVLRQSK